MAHHVLVMKARSVAVTLIDQCDSKAALVEAVQDELGDVDEAAVADGVSVAWCRKIAFG